MAAITNSTGTTQWDATLGKAKKRGWQECESTNERQKISKEGREALCQSNSQFNPSLNKRIFLTSYSRDYLLLSPSPPFPTLFLYYTLSLALSAHTHIPSPIKKEIMAPLQLNSKTSAAGRKAKPSAASVANQDVLRVHDSRIPEQCYFTSQIWGWPQVGQSKRNVP